MSDPTADATDDPQARIDTFWDEARRRARLDWLPGFGTATPVAALQPPAWSFGATPEQADELLELVLAGTKTATASLLSDYCEEDPVPEVGTMGIVLDGAGRPRALVATTSVRVVPFADVPAEHAHAEGEGDRSLEYWRRVHREFFSTHSLGGAEVPDDAPVVLEEIRVLYPKPPRQR
ncbi:MAG: ASCH domain-containing protein [Propionibacterium sp.]|nr:ASCH domain-containing protein [Propionibacterium sp.]